jgi:hypothetical protein
LEVPDIGHLRVIHPIDVLDSRIQNLHLLPEKRTDAGIAQGRLAVGVVRAFIRREVATRDERVGVKLLERLADIAGDMAALRVFLLLWRRSAACRAARGLPNHRRPPRGAVAANRCGSRREARVAAQALVPAGAIGPSR